MPDDKPNPLDDVRKGLGLLFRAAKTTIEKLPTKDIEEVVVTTAREVGRAVENVGKTIERDVFGGKVVGRTPPADQAAKPDEPRVEDTKADDAKAEEPKDGEPKPPQAS